ncbi:MAG TPA: hypothetical protein VJQ49_10165 [Casimicrobiaceae bacterium]|nr:hypothetical protein [Casimicrobiaceae bacterium]
MKRIHLAQALLVASFGAFAMAGYAADTSSADKTPGSPGKTATQPGTGAMQNNGMSNSMNNGMKGSMREPMTSEQIRAYEQERTVCDTGPASARGDCWSKLTIKYSGVSPKCQKLTGNALDACIHQDQTAKQ